MIPNTGFLGTELNYPTLNGYAISRECSANPLPVMTLDSIMYPTGGSSKFIYEPHESVMLPSKPVTGGGLRVKTIRHYSLGKLANTTNYSYSVGTYMGTIQYRTSYWGKQQNQGYVGIPIDQQDTKIDNLSSNGVVNDNDLLIAYPQVTVTQNDEKGISNGSIVKKFKVPFPSYGNTGMGFDVLSAHWPSGTRCDPVYGGCLTYNNSTDYLYPSASGFPPTPSKQLDGKLIEEQYLDHSNNLVKSVNYYYRQADYSQKFYSVRIRDNRIGGPDATGTNEFETTGQRRYTIFVSPAKSYYTLLDSVVEKTYQGSNLITSKRAYQYNGHYQPAYEVVYNSDNTQTITYTKTSVEMEPPLYSLAPTGDALLIHELKSAHIYDLPIEQTIIKRSAIGDSLVLRSRLNIYQNGLPLKIYELETAVPLTYKSQFVPLYPTYSNYPNNPTGSSYSLQMDSRYKMQSKADYSSNSQIKGLHSIEGNSVYIWDEYYNNILAQCINADSSDIAFTSFETPARGHWVLNSTGIVTDNTAPTGTKAYSLLSGSISMGGLNTTKPFVVSYWCKGGAQNVNGTTVTAGMSVNGWTYYEHKLDNLSGGSIAINGSDIIDELRLYPYGSLMTTYNYEQLIGLSSQCDVNNKITYYEYDAIGRVSRIRDYNRNILKQFTYKHGDIFQFPYANTEQRKTYKKDNCPEGYDGSIIEYVVPSGKYGSFSSVQDANQKALAEITAFDGQSKVNETGSCIPSISFAPCCGWGSAYSNFALTGTGSVDFSFVIYNNTGVAYGQFGTLNGALFLPSTTRYVTVTSGGKSYTLVFYPSGQVNIMGSNFSGYLQLNGTYPL